MARRSEHSREELCEMAIQATSDLVLSEGASALSARKIANQIGYTVGTLYWAFENLDDLILHVNARTLEDLQAVLSEAIVDCREPEACLLVLAKKYLTFSQEKHGLWSLIYEHELKDNEMLPAWYQDYIDQIFNLIDQQLISIITDIKRRVEFARVLWCGVHGIAVLSTSGKIDNDEIESADRLVELQIKTLLAGLSRGEDE